MNEINPSCALYAIALTIVVGMACSPRPTSNIRSKTLSQALDAPYSIEVQLRGSPRAIYRLRMSERRDQAWFGHFCQAVQDSSVLSLSAAPTSCVFRTDVVVRIRGKRSADVHFCFGCEEFEVVALGAPDPLGGARLSSTSSFKNLFQELFPSRRTKW